MTNLLFDFGNPDTLLVKATKATNQRRSGTVADTVRHAIIHTPSPDATLHHTIIAACPHPDRAKAAEGLHYMVGYVSIPIDWLKLVNKSFVDQHTVTFVGPAGAIQRLPVALSEMDELLGQRFYIGFDWMGSMMLKIQQPSYEQIKQVLHNATHALRIQADA